MQGKRGKYRLFYIGFILLYISYFIGDVNIEGNLAQYVRFISYGIICLNLFVTRIKWTVRQYIFLILAVIVSMFLYVKTGDLYFGILIMLILNAQDIEEKDIIKISYITLLIGTMVVVSLCLIGVIDNINTIRNTLDTRTRRGWGFYHSNVLPLILMYLTSYKILLKKDSIKNRELIGAGIIGTLLYILSNSRNAYISLIFILFSALILKNIKQKEFTKFINMMAKISMPLACGFSIAMMFLLLRGGIWDRIEGFFSGRFRSAIFKSRIVGVHFINLMNNKTFIADGIILDNGYLYILLRYGVIMVGLMLVVFYLLNKKIAGEKYSNLILTALSIANMLDNDLLDYSCLPFMILAFSNMRGIYYPNRKVKR